MKRVAFLLLTVLLLAGCAEKKIDVTIEKRSSQETVSFHSEAVAKNTIKDLSTMSIIVMLPPDYRSEGEPHKVVYFLAGYESSVRYLTLFANQMKNAMEQGTSDSIVFVSVNGVNKHLGSFYRNSEVTGYWEDFVIQEVISVVQQNYNVSEEKQGRGLAGHSMGGFGALNIALDHPDLFNAVLAYGPAVIQNEELQTVIDTWTTMRTSRGTGVCLTAYSLAIMGEEKVPMLDGSEEDNRVRDRWLEGLGNWDQKIDRSYKQRNPLQKIMIIYGEDEDFPWIMDGSNHIGSLLKQKGIPHEVHAVKGTHGMSPDGIINNMLPFFSENLE